MSHQQLESLGCDAEIDHSLGETQGEKVICFAQQLGTHCVNLMFNCEQSGTDGAKEALWFFAERRVDVRLIWSPTMHNGEFNGRQPEGLNRADIEQIIAAKSQHPLRAEHVP